MSRLSLLLPITALAVACSAAPQPELERRLADHIGLVSNTIDLQAPEGTERAHIYEIDGETVAHYQTTFALEPGDHTIRVWPLGPAQRMVPDLELIEREGIQVDPIVLEVEGGHRYYLGARRKRSRTMVTMVMEDAVEESAGEWRETIEPVVVKIAEPMNLVQKVQGASGFFGSLLIGPLLGAGSLF